jgi:hypothetical protein
MTPIVWRPLACRTSRIRLGIAQAVAQTCELAGKRVDLEPFAAMVWLSASMVSS